MTTAGRRDKLIVFQRAAVVTDDYGHDTQTWGDHASEWAEVRYGNSGERRGAAQEEASIAATFAVLDNSLTRAILPTDRIQFEGVWNISSNVPARQLGEREITAVRQVSQ